MYNEMQAYLMFTYDARFFQPSNVGMTAARRQQLAAAFLRGMPAGWLHDALAQDLPTCAEPPAWRRPTGLRATSPAYPPAAACPRPASGLRSRAIAAASPRR